MAPREATEAPTEKKKKEARSEGRIARSQELSSWVAVIVGLAMLPVVAERETKVFREAISRVQSPGAESLPRVLGDVLWGGLLGVAPLLAAVWGAVFAVTLAQVGFVLSGKPLKPKAERLNPVKNLKRIVGVRGLVELLKQVLKGVVVVILMWGVVRTVSSTLIGRGGEDAIQSVAYVYKRLAGGVRTVAVLGTILAVLDYGYQRWQLRRDLRMTKQEVRDELRQSEGDPLVKQRIRQLQREMARRRMMDDVRTATTVIVNPTRIAVALRYRPGVDTAPVVVAKGRGAIARRIRDTATDNRVPVVRSVQLARALEKSCEVGDEVPAALFQAVARVLAFIARVGRQVMWAGVMDLPAAWETPIGDVPVRRRRRGARGRA